MKENKITISLILMIIISIVMIEPVTADPCPQPNTWTDRQESAFVTVVPTDLGSNLINYAVIGATSSDTIKEVCIATPEAIAQSGTVNWYPSELWSFAVKNSAWAQFGPSHPYIPFDGTLHDVGNVQWSSSSDKFKFLLHVVSVDPNGLCGVAETSVHNKKTCFIKPVGSIPPIPELNTTVLVSAGIIGLVLISRKSKNN